MSADDDLGYVDLPFSTPANDNYGGQRPGNGPFGESLICLDARSGKRRWHFQMVHHGLWDYDPPAGPNLIDILVNGMPVKAVAQVSKHGFCYVFDRVTGKPIWPIEEKRVPVNSSRREIFAESAFPHQARAFDRQGITEIDVIDFTPELHEEALAILKKYNFGRLFTPPPWRSPRCAGHSRRRKLGGRGVRSRDRNFMHTVNYCPVRSVVTEVASTACRLRRPSVAPVETMNAVALWKPPYGRITAIDTNMRDHRWMVPMGDLAKSSPVLQSLHLRPLGRSARGHALLTKTLLVIGQEGTTQREINAARGTVVGVNFEIHEPKLCAYDKANGKVVGEVALPRNATAAPMPYMLKGKQFIVVASGGGNLPAEPIAFGL